MKCKTLREIGEFGLINRIAKKSDKADTTVLAGIGDDAAVIDTHGYDTMLVTTDALVEDVHFRRHYPPDALGWKALSVNISDIAAMGGIPRYYLLSISVPGDISPGYLDQFFSGMEEAARRYGLTLIGGDTTSSPDRMYISITVIGEPSGNILLRKGAQPGDAIFVTGTLGDSALGLRLLEEGRGAAPTDDVKKMINRHLRPVPRVEDGMSLSKSGFTTSMIDVSDGLLADLGHICEESGSGARIWLDRLPLSEQFKSISEGYGGLELALSGGEDYELLFTVNGKKVEEFLDEIKGKMFTRIGEIMGGSGIEVIRDNGEIYIPTGRGYEHLKG